MSLNPPHVSASPSEGDVLQLSSHMVSIESRKTDHTLEFGKISFKREVIRRNNPSVKNKGECQDPGAIICDKEAVPALCGFRAIWVVPSRRRKRIGSKLMDVAR